MGLFDSVGAAGSLFTDREGSPRWWVWVLGGIALVFLMGVGIYYLPDYGACLKGHSEPRHRDAWVEVQVHTTCYGVRETNCVTSTYPIFHPAQDWSEWVCEVWEFPEGDGREQRRLRKER